MELSQDGYTSEVVNGEIQIHFETKYSVKLVARFANGQWKDFWDGASDELKAEAIEISEVAKQTSYPTALYKGDDAREARVAIRKEMTPPSSCNCDIHSFDYIEDGCYCGALPVRQYGW